MEEEKQLRAVDADVPLLHSFRLEARLCQVIRRQVLEKSFVRSFAFFSLNISSKRKAHQLPWLGAALPCLRSSSRRPRQGSSFPFFFLSNFAARTKNPPAKSFYSLFVRAELEPSLRRNPIWVFRLSKARPFKCGGGSKLEST